MAAGDVPRGRAVASAAPRFGGGQDLRERVQLLEQAPLFSVLPSNELEVLGGKFYGIRYRRGEMIFRGRASRPSASSSSKAAG